MKAPNVIFVDDLAVVNDCATKISIHSLPNFSEYIHKDALMELLKPEKDISFPDDYERGCIDGRNGLRVELIDKLNSM